MSRVIGGMTSGLVMVTGFLAALHAQEPGKGQPPRPEARTGEAARSGASGKSGAPGKSGEPAKGKEPAGAESKKPETGDETPVVTHHRIRVGGEELKYTATAGLMPIKDDKGETEARIFYMAYTRDEAGPAAARPLLFSFNGGPGSASVWLHLGALGPRRVAAPDEPVIPAPPFRLVDNDATWLDRTDLVFIDPVGTGYSRAAKPELNARFHSVSGDIESVGEFIRMYLTRNGRWASPLFLIGESYGTTRAAGLAGHLVDHGIALNGVILVSCALDFQGFSFTPGNDLPFLNYLPSYAATAWYHKRLPAALNRIALPVLLREVEEWADREYAAVLARGDRLSDDERTRAAERLARYTGLKADDIAEHRLRIVMSHFCDELLKAEHRSIGRFDSRYKGIENLAANDRPGPSHDPSLAAVRAPYTTTFNHYIREELGYKTDTHYHILGEGVGRWDFQTTMGYPATTSALADAMVKNPHMQVLIASGYYDLATPYRAVDEALAGLGLDPALRKNITTATYEAGHMMYLHAPSLYKLKHDGAALLDRTLKK